MKNIFLICFVFCNSFVFGNIKFTSTYDQWKSKSNNFIEYIDSKDQARVVFIGSESSSSDGSGKRPTVSEGMGYGLLLAYANNDQKLFDKFLRYILEVSTQHGCCEFNKKCQERCYFLMPWLVNENGNPFWSSSNSSDNKYYSSGSATDADIQIAWAIYLAAKRVASKKWKSTLFKTVFGLEPYKNIFYQISREIRLYDVDHDTKVIKPGNQWGEAGKKVFYPGYFTPQAFVALKKAKPQKIGKIERKGFPILFKNNSTKTLYIEKFSGKGGLLLDKYFIKGNNNIYSIVPLTSGVAEFFPTDKLDSNLYVKVAVNKENKIFSHYLISLTNGRWHIKEKSSSSNGVQFDIIDNKVHIELQRPAADKVNFSFSTVSKNSSKVIKNFQKENDTGLLPNVIHFDDNYLNRFDESFSFDSIRYLLWVGSYIDKKYISREALLLRTIQKKLYSDAIKYIKKGKRGWSFPSQGVNVFSKKSMGGFDYPSVSLNAPLLLAAFFRKDKITYQKLFPYIASYSIKDNQPALHNKKDDSSPYYNACIILLTKALMEKRFK
jgi:endo-1,4-beta-D-glucanase Y